MKKMLRCALRGFLAGVALLYLASLALCAGLRLGYFMPYLASMPEMVGGELNAAALMALICGVLGALVAVLCRLLRRRARRDRRAAKRG